MNLLLSRFLLLAFVCSLCSVFLGCDKKTATSTSETPSQPLAKVNGELISTSDVDEMLESLMQKQALTLVDEKLRTKVLDSLIASRAMKQQVLAQLTPEEQQEITKRVKRYEEELYVKEYLQRNVTPDTVTMEMIQQYYNEHLDEFGAEVLRDFELLKAPAVKNDKERDPLLAAIPEIQKMNNWRAQSKNLQQKYGVVFQEGRNKAGLLHPPLDQMISNLEKGSTSDVFYIDNELYLVRVTATSETAAKPLAEVSDDIRKQLAANLLRDAVKKASEKARAEAKVEFF